MLRKISLLAFVAGSLTASAAMAEEHVVLIMPEAYFPAITYVDPGDTVRFINTTESDHNIIAKHDAWAIGPISANAETLMAIEGGLQGEFYNADSVGTDETSGEQTYLVAGILSFSAPPLD